MSSPALRLSEGDHVPGKPQAYARETILDQEQLAEWLQLSVTVVKGLGLPRLNLQGCRAVRYSAGQVLDFLEGRIPAPEQQR